MKTDKGITFVSLVVYVIVMIIVISVMSYIITNFYNNTDATRGNVQEITEFNKFNTYFLKEVKKPNNGIDHISDTYILFKSGNSFSISNNILYYNNKELCYNVQNMQITLGKNGDGIDKTIVNVKVSFENFEKSMSYKIEDIY